jgi:hypothetical protein
MAASSSTEGFVLRLQIVSGATWIRVQNVRTGQMREFASWEACLRYFRSYSPPSGDDGAGSPRARAHARREP